VEIAVPEMAINKREEVMSMMRMKLHAQSPTVMWIEALTSVGTVQLTRFDAWCT